MRFVLVIAWISVFAWLLAGAVDQEFASAARVQGAAGFSVREPHSAPSSFSSRAASIRAIRKVFGARAPAAIRVASCETGGTFYARAVSRTGDYGLFQANYQAHHWRGESHAAFARRHFNLAYHVRWAYKLSRGGTNWRPWACRWAA